MDKKFEVKTNDDNKVIIEGCKSKEDYQMIRRMMKISTGKLRIRM